MNKRSVLVNWLGAVKPLYQRLPAGFRHAPAITRLRNRFAPHELLYTTEYFEIVQAAAASSAPLIADSIVREFHPGLVIDVGCGSGDLLLALQSRGCECYGLEYSIPGLEQCRARGLNVTRFDLEKDSLDVMIEYNLAISMEVAEHLPARMADRFVDLLTRLAPIVVFTAAVPG